MNKKYICHAFECTNERSMPFTSRYCDKHWDRNKTTEELVEGLRHYHTYLSNSGECIDNDCEIVKESAEQIADRLEELEKKIEKAKNYIIDEDCHCEHDINGPIYCCDRCRIMDELEK